jgi:predicted Zn-dependent peptidase
VFSTLLGGGMSSRLFQEVREKRGLVYSIYSFPTSFIDGGLFGIYAGTGESEVAELIPLVCAEMVKVASDVSEAEVARAKAQLKSSILMSLESTSARCEQLARQLVVFGRPLSLDEVVSKVTAVDVDAVRRVARRLIEAPLTLTGLGPLGNLPRYDDVMSCLRH